MWNTFNLGQYKLKNSYVVILQPTGLTKNVKFWQYHLLMTFSGKHLLSHTASGNGMDAAILGTMNWNVDPKKSSYNSSVSANKISISAQGDINRDELKTS